MAGRSRDFKINVISKSDPRGFKDTEKSLHGLNVALGNSSRETKIFQGSIKALKFPAMVAGAGIAAQAVSNLGAAAVATGAALAPLSGAIAAYPTLATTAAQGIGVFKLATQGVGQAVGGLNEKLDTSTKQFKALSPEAQSFAKTLDGMKPQVQGIQRAAQKGLFPGLEKGVRAASKNLPVFNKIAGDTGRAIGHVAAQAGKLAGSKAWGKDFATQGARNAKWIKTLGGASLHMGDALRHVILAAGPLVGWMVKLAAKAAVWIDRQAKAGRESGRMAKFFEQTRRVMVQVGRIAGGLATAFWNIGKAAAPLGRSILKAVADNAVAFGKWTKSAEGHNKIAAYFRSARAPVFELGRLIRDVTKTFFSLGSGHQVAPLLRQIRTQLLPVFARVVKSTTAAFGPALVNTLVQVLKLFGHMAGSNGPLVQIVKLVGTLARGLNNLLDRFPALNTALVTLAGLGGIAKALGVVSAITGMTRLVRLIKTANAATAAGAAGGAGGGLAGAAAGRVRAAGAAGAGAFAGGVGLRGAAGAAARAGLGATGAAAAAITGVLGVAVGLKKAAQAIDDTTGRATKRFRTLVKAVNAGAISVRRAKQYADSPFGSSFTKAQRVAIRSLNQTAVAIRQFNRRNHVRIPVDTKITQTGLRVVRNAFERTSESSGKSISDIRTATSIGMIEIRKVMGANSKGGREAVARNMRLAVQAVGKSMESGKVSSRDGMREIRRLMRVHSKGGRDSVQKNFQNALAVIRGAMRNAKGSTRAGMAEVARQMEVNLHRSFGFSLAEARNLTRTGDDQGRNVRSKSYVGNHARGGRAKAPGGWVGNPGERGGDNVPIVVGRGEAILNRHQQPIVEAALRNTFGATLDDLFAAVKRPHYMASGGRVEKHARGGLGGVHAGVARAAGSILRHFPGLAVTSTTGGGHAAGSYHYRGEAVDLASGDYGLMNRAAGWIKQTMGRGLAEGIHNPNLSIKHGRGVSPGYWGATTWGNHRNHIHIAVGGAGGPLVGLPGGGGMGAQAAMVKMPRWAGPGGTLGLYGQAALKRGTQAANKRIRQINAKFGDSFGGITTGGGSAQANRVLARRMMMRMWPASEWPALRRLWDSESGFRTHATNPSSGAYGIPQSLPAGKMASEGRDWRNNPATQIRWGLKYIKGRYGRPSNTPLGGYSRGGFIRGEIGRAIRGVDTAKLTKGYADDRRAGKQLVIARTDQMNYWKGRREHWRKLATSGPVKGRTIALRNFHLADDRAKSAQRELGQARTAYIALPGRPFPASTMTQGDRIHADFISAGQAVTIADADGSTTDQDSLKAAGRLVMVDQARVNYWRGRVAHWRSRMHNRKLSAAARKTARANYNNAVTQLGGVSGDLASATSDLQGRVPETTETDTSAADLATAIKELKDSVDAQNQQLRTIQGTAANTAIKALADHMSGQLGYATTQRARTPNAGVLARY